jgi:hypothetical protein
VSNDIDRLRYDHNSVRDMACFGSLVFASGLIVIVSENGPLASRIGAKCGRETKGDNDHGHISRQCCVTG